MLFLLSGGSLKQHGVAGGLFSFGRLCSLSAGLSEAMERARRQVLAMSWPKQRHLDVVGGGLVLLGESLLGVQTAVFVRWYGREFFVSQSSVLQRGFGFLMASAWMDSVFFGIQRGPTTG